MVELVTDYLEGALMPADRARFEAHLAKCDGCTAYLEQLRVVQLALGRISEDDLDPVFRTRLLDAFDDTAGSW